MKKTLFLMVIFTLSLLGSCKTPPEETADLPSGIEDIFAGVSNVFILLSDGTFWGAGYNHWGQLGLEAAETGMSYAAQEFTRISLGGEDSSKVKTAAAGENYTLALKEDGTLWAAGLSLYGELGQGEDGAGSFAVFSQLKDESGALINNVESIAAGSNTVFFIKNDRTLWASGYNYYGELGLGDRVSRLSFTQVSGAGQDVKAIAPGARHTVLLKNDGSVWTAGYNFNGQLGLDNDEDAPLFTRVSDLDSVTAVAAGNYHTVALRNDGTVWTTGENYYGQLGHNGEGQRRFAQLRDSQGQVFNDVAAIAAHGDLTLLIKKDGSLLLAGNCEEPEYDSNSGPPPPLEGEPESTLILLEPEEGGSIGEVKKIVLGSRNIYVLSADGFVWAAGSNRYGQLALDLDVTDSLVLKKVYPRS